MPQLIEIKQVANAAGRQVKADVVGKAVGFGEFTMFPNSFRSFVPMKRQDGTYITGLEKESPEKIAQLEKALGVDLSPYNSEFWEVLRIQFDMPDGTMRWDISHPLKYIEYKAALGNKFLAPDLESAKDDEAYINKTFFYVHDNELIEKNSSLLNELKDEIASEMYKYRNSQEHLLFLVAGLGKFTTSGMKPDTLYNMLSGERDKLKKLKELENFRNHLKKSRAELQAGYYVKEALNLGFIGFDTEINKYKFKLANIAVGSTPENVIAYFADKKNEEHLAMLANEVIETRK